MGTSKDMARALRRHHAARLKKVRASYWGRQCPAIYVEAMTARQLGMALATPAICSCPACGNPRNYFGERTLQEERWYQLGLVDLEGL